MNKLIGLTTIFSVVFFAFILNADEESKDTNFSITGDFNSVMAIDFSDATVSVSMTGLSDEGKPTDVVLASSALVDAKFTLEGFVEEATVADINLTLPDQQRPTTGRVILEPGGELTVEFLGPYHSLIATGDGLHAELISSWASDPEYLDASIGYGYYMESFYGRLDKEQARMEAETAEAAANLVEEEMAEEQESKVAESEEEEVETVAAEMIEEQREPTEHAEVLDWASMECADYTVDFVSVLDRDEFDYEYPLVTQSTMRMGELMAAKRNASLEKVVLESVDPQKRLLAMELGAFSGMGNQTDALSAWRQLAIALDEDVVAARVQPTIDRLERRVAIAENDEYLVPGVFAPKFTLPNFEGTEVALTSILEENEVVMIDFWASWCGPCIAQFPHLKELYASYAEKGFEIVGISVDSTQEDWAGAVEEHQPPWVNLGEINEDSWGQISQDFGVRFIPHTYVLDDENCIMKKDLQPDELEDFLKARLDS